MYPGRVIMPVDNWTYDVIDDVIMTKYVNILNSCNFVHI